MTLDRIGLYLWSRGLSGTVPDPSVFRFDEACAYLDGEGAKVGDFPAMLARVVDLAGEEVTLHRTYLDPEGLGKARVSKPKKLLPPVKPGATMGAAVRLTPAGRVLAITEGIETGLAVYEATGTATWAAISAAGMEAVELPQEVEEVELWADHDRPDRKGNQRGLQAAHKAAERFRAEKREVRVYVPPVLGADWLDVWNAWGAAAFRWARGFDGPHARQFGPTELGNARRLVRLHGLDLRHDCAAGVWYVWTGARWTPDLKGEADRRAKDVCRELWLEIADADDGERGRLVKHAKTSESAKGVRSMLFLAGTEDLMPVEAKDTDLDPWALNVLNGTLDLRTGTLREHRRVDLLTKRCPVTFDPAATCPEWRKFLQEVTDGDEEVEKYLQRVAGYSATGDTREDCFFIHWGPEGRNGKSVFLGTLSRILGGYATATNPETFMQRDRPTGGQATPELAELQGARLVMASEMEHGQRLSEALVKRITGRDPIKARFLYQRSHVEFFPTFKVHLPTNHRPRIAGRDPAIWARVRVVLWPVSFHGRENRKLPEILWEERSGILNWILSGCLAWLREGKLSEPKAIQEETAKYKEDSDTLGQWLSECCQVGPAEKCALSEGFGSYRGWMKDAGLEKVALAKPAWTTAMEERGFTRKRDNSSRWWAGFGLRAV